jgi:polyhydroxybutyrate depolymerase
MRFLRTVVVFCIVVLAACAAPIVKTPAVTTQPSTPSQSVTSTETGIKTTQNYTKPQQYEYSATIKYKQTEWIYLIHIPHLYDGTKAVPLVVALHPANGNSKQIATITGFNTIAEGENFIVVYPKSFNAHWNCGTKALQIQDVDEIGFIVSLIDNLSPQFNIDSKKVFVTGLSSGGSMCFTLAGRLSEKIASIATVGSTIFEDMLPELKPKVPLSVLHIHGTKDPVIPWQGGNTSNIKAFSGGAAVRVFSVAEIIKFWVDSNRCMSTPDITQLPDNNARDGTKVKIEKYSGGTNGTEVVLYAVEEGGHTWPDSKNPQYEVATGKICHDFDASEAIWQFFKQHPKKQ